MEIKDGKTGSPEAKPHGSPGRKKEIREIKKPFREPAWGQPEEPGGGTKDSGKKWGSRSRMLDGNPQRLKRRRATLPHPLECSTIAAPGLSYRVRNGTGRLTRAMTTANLTATARKPKESKPACYRWRFGEPASGREANAYRLNRIRDHQALIVAWDRSTGKTRNQPSTRGSELLCRHRPLVPVGSTPSRGFHLRPIKHVFNMRATGSRRSMES